MTFIGEVVPVTRYQYNCYFWRDNPRCLCGRSEGPITSAKHLNWAKGVKLHPLARYGDHRVYS